MLVKISVAGAILLVLMLGITKSSDETMRSPLGKIVLGVLLLLCAWFMLGR